MYTIPLSASGPNFSYVVALFFSSQMNPGSTVKCRSEHACMHRWIDVGHVPNWALRVVYIRGCALAYLVQSAPEQRVERDLLGSGQRSVHIDTEDKMARQQVGSMLAVVALIIGAFASVPTSVQSIGVCYGTLGNNLPSSSDVVQLYRSKGINGMRLYSPDKRALDALRGSGIALILDVGGADAVRSLAASAGNAASWVRDNVSPYYPAVSIKYIAVGNELQGGDAQSILPAMRNLAGALAAAGLAGAVKVSTAVRFDVVANSYPPSRGAFAPAYMTDVARFLAGAGAPLLANVYPYFAYRDNRGIKLGYATFRPGEAVRDDGSGLTYTSLFDAMVDAVHAALEKAGAAGVRVVVSESGWPAAGGYGATAENARAYNQGLIDHVGGGTPRRPGALETFVFAMFNENQKTGDEIERHFGLFNPDKSPAYAIRF
ncbi:hypothetical protein ACP4OV_019481 [Aristida adscensionis]